ncbi:hypothetical protein ACH5RR_016428 [Cinchona calisaya]|uniref:Uncharacterized protein n=1 Tax=Cinchona calisaya TaxID=153742 RepID=A0ABD2ZWX5_9GENT
MLLEFITGRRAFDLARLANDDDVMLLDWVALFCTRNPPIKRLKMSEVIKMLEGDGLAERWQEWQEEEMFEREFNQTLNPNTDELSGPR